MIPKKINSHWSDKGGLGLLILLWLAFFLNQADRQIFSVVLPLIRQDLGLTDAELGLIASALIWTYGLLVPVAGWVGDRFSRRNIIGFALLFWSLSTLCTGFCTTLIQFVLLRGIATGGGEAFYAPSANAMLGERYAQNRAFVLSIHQTAVYFGIVLSGLIAGYVGQYYGWQNAFFLFGGFGIVVAMVFFWQIPNNTSTAIVKEVSKISFKEIGSEPSFWLLTLAFGCMVFVNVGYLTWMPSFLAEKFNLSLTEAGFSSLFYHHIGAFLGVLSGAKIADYFAKKHPQARPIVQALGLFLGAPFIYLMSTTNSVTITYISLFLFGVFRGWYDSNIVASLYEIVPERYRSSAYGLMLACAFLVGATSPYLLGVLKPTLGMAVGLSYLSLVYVLGAILLGGAAVLFVKKKQVPYIFELLASNLRFPEGPAFAPDGSLWAVELKGESLVQIHHSSPKSYHVGGSPNGIAVDNDGHIVFCDATQNAIRRFDIATHQTSTLVEIEGNPNDLAFDSAGNLVFTCPNNARQKPLGYVCVRKKDGIVKKIAENLYFPNGLAFTPNGHELIIAETYRHRLWKGQWNSQTCEWSNAQVWCEIGGPNGPGGPDGMAFGPDGNLYVAVYGTGQVRIVNPEGEVIGHIKTDGQNPTNCAFDPSKNNELFITEAEKGNIWRCKINK